MGSPPRRRGRPEIRFTPATQSGAHPRAGGDGDRVGKYLAKAVGSPPRRRGRLPAGLPDRRPVGLTPAQAGTAPPNATSPTHRRAHPRAGGDGDPGIRDFIWPQGSPPRRRGRLAGGVWHDPALGLTPAQAGTAHRSRRPAWPWRAHPRAGGDGTSICASSIAFMGSPPRRRGRRPERWQHGGHLRLTPAQAGTAPGVWSFDRPGWAHPRAGGDGLNQRSPRGCGRGSPPRRRGRPCICARTRCRRGLTPAQAGTACVVARRAGKSCGSPPRRRGRRVDSNGYITRRGLTPAQAGTAPCWLYRQPRNRAHPRAGGDGAMSRIDSTIEWGSPPRRRGRLNTGGWGGQREGLTPAQAGTASARLSG